MSEVWPAACTGVAWGDRIYCAKCPCRVFRTKTAVKLQGAIQASSTRKQRASGSLCFSFWIKFWLVHLQNLFHVIKFLTILTFSYLSQRHLSFIVLLILNWFLVGAFSEAVLNCYIPFKSSHLVSWPPCGVKTHSLWRYPPDNPRSWDEVWIT